MTLRFEEETVSGVRLLDVVVRDVLTEHVQRVGVVLLEGVPMRPMNEAFWQGVAHVASQPFVHCGISVSRR